MLYHLHSCPSSTPPNHIVIASLVNLGNAYRYLYLRLSCSSPYTRI
ncbi:unnamed protein product [Penicillium roqueforti FM164]|uniref:Genomic scaffold, ProqFM164S01 n=1 Tax=Penicillium roqueforti (strain FM164) TaxID=1365484 RepID=W6Q0L0_PENRF|nr:unnamed protein product [Penicillium roqueforti FM164]